MLTPEGDRLVEHDLEHVTLEFETMILGNFGGEPMTQRCHRAPSEFKSGFLVDPSAAAGRRKDTETLLTCCQRADTETLLAVMAEERKSTIYTLPKRRRGNTNPDARVSLRNCNRDGGI